MRGGPNKIRFDCTGGGSDGGAVAARIGSVSRGAIAVFENA